MSHKFFLVDLSYIRPLEEIDSHRDAHITFLEAQYAEENFIFSGPKEPREGGVILAKVENRSVLDSILNDDPFNKKDLACYTVTEFYPWMCADGFRAFVDKT